MLKFSDLIPTENYLVLTNLSEEEVLMRLRKIIGNQERKFHNSFMGIDLRQHSDSSFDYEGSISDKTFKISRVIRYRNSFLPVIKGTVSSFVNKNGNPYFHEDVLVCKNRHDHLAFTGRNSGSPGAFCNIDSLDKPKFTGN